MEDYEALVEKAFSTGSPLPFSNESALHARVVMKHIIRNARQEVRLYSTELPAAVTVPTMTDTQDVEVYAWGELLEEIKKFVNKAPAHKLLIKVRQPQPEHQQVDKPHLCDLAAQYPAQITIDWNKPSDKKDFMVNDQGAFRFEFEQHQAIACAINEEVAKKLQAVFNDL